MFCISPIFLNSLNHFASSLFLRNLCSLLFLFSSDLSPPPFSLWILLCLLHILTRFHIFPDYYGFSAPTELIFLYYPGRWRIVVRPSVSCWSQNKQNCLHRAKKKKINITVKGIKDLINSWLKNAVYIRPFFNVKLDKSNTVQLIVNCKSWYLRCNIFIIDRVNR